MEDTVCFGENYTLSDGTILENMETSKVDTSYFIAKNGLDSLIIVDLIVDELKKPLV